MLRMSLTLFALLLILPLSACNIGISQTVGPPPTATKATTVVAKADAAAATSAAASPAAKPKASEAMRSYFNTMKGIYSDFTGAVTDMGHLLSEAMRNPTLLANQAWRDSISERASIIRNSAQRIRSQTSVPDEMRTLHTLMTATADDLSYIASELTGALSDRDPSRLAGTTVRLKAINERNSSIAAEIKRLNDKYEW